MQLQGIEVLRGRGVLELNLQLCDQTQCETHERDGVRVQSEQRKSTDGATVVRIVVLQLVLLLKEKMTASRPSEHPPARGKHVKTFT